MEKGGTLLKIKKLGRGRKQNGRRKQNEFHLKSLRGSGILKFLLLVRVH